MEDVKTVVILLDLVVMLGLGIIGLFLTHSLRRQVKQKTADERVKSYAELWQIMELASPSRLKDWHPETAEEKPKKGPLTPEERDELYAEIMKWYYRSGNGMYLGDSTRRLFLTAKDNLICPDKKLKPEKLYQEFVQDPSEEECLKKRGKLSIRQLSLLRTRMRADLEVYGALYLEELKTEDKEFLEHCDEDWRRKPWNPRPWWLRWLPEQPPTELAEI